METLIMYYSFEGNTRLIAETIANELKADIQELKPKKDLTSKGFMKYLWGGKQVVMRNMPELMPLDKKPEDYDLIFIGSPVWAGSFAPALKTFFNENKLTNKKVAVFCCHGGGGNGRLFKNIRRHLPNCDIIEEIEFRDPKKRDTEQNIIKAKEWCCTTKGSYSSSLES